MKESPMDWLTAVTKIVNSVACPIVVLIVVSWLRPNLPALMDRFFELRFPGGHVKFRPQPPKTESFTPVGGQSKKS